jgi:trimeric autotransporter adhesin
METVQNYSDQRQVGVIAQEVQAVLPEVVGNVTKEFLGVDYAFLTPLLIEGIKELDQDARETDEVVAELQRRVAELERQLENILARLPAAP